MGTPAVCSSRNLPGQAPFKDSVRPNLSQPDQCASLATKWRPKHGVGARYMHHNESYIDGSHSSGAKPHNYRLERP